MKKVKCLHLIIIALLLNIYQGYTQNKISTDDYYIDFSTPDIGAFTLLNVKPDNTSMPGNPKEFAASLLNVVSSGSNITPGLAIDWSPIKTFYKTTTHEDYKKYHLIRNLQITFGTISDSLGSRVGAGIKWTFYDKSDPLLDDSLRNKLEATNPLISISNAKHTFLIETNRILSKIFRERKLDDKTDILVNDYFELGDTLISKRETIINYQMVVDTIGILIINSDNNMKLTDSEKNDLLSLCIKYKKLTTNIEEFKKSEIESFLAIKKKWHEEHWNATVITLGSGWTGNSIENKWSTLKTEVFKSYLNGKFKVGKRAQAVGMVSFGKPHNARTNDSTIVSQVFCGGRFLVGNTNNRFSIDLGYGYEFAKDSKYDAKTAIANIGLEFKLDDGIFLEIAAGFKGEPSNFLKDSNILALGSLKYTLKPKSRF